MSYSTDPVLDASRYYDALDEMQEDDKLREALDDECTRPVLRAIRAMQFMTPGALAQIVAALATRTQTGHFNEEAKERALNYLDDLHGDMEHFA